GLYWTDRGVGKALREPQARALERAGGGRAERGARRDRRDREDKLARGRIGPGGPTGLQNQLGSVRTLVGSIPTRSRQGPPVIFIPGLGNTVHVYAGFAGRVTARHPVVAVTTWGFGASLPNDRGARLDTIRSWTAPATTCRIGTA